MKKFNKKGFTIVELVIVIAVIGVLAGVLIPTFSNVIASANASAALQAARGCLSSALNMSTTGSLPGYDTESEKYQTVFFVDQNDDGLVDYQFLYKGNELEAVDRKDHTKDWKFNSVLMFSGSMKDTYQYTTGSPTSIVTHYTLSDKKPTEANENSFGKSTDHFSLSNKTANMIYSALNYYNDSNSYTLIDGIATLPKASTNDTTVRYNKLGTVGGIELDQNKNYVPAYKYTTTNNVKTLDKDNSPYTDGADNLARFFLNSDFSSKVIIFTTFSL